jgi:DNA polymerase-1
MISLGDFSDITFIDFEFSQPRGSLPSPICLVGHELRTGVVHRVWQDELSLLEKAPYPTGQGALVVAYYAIAEMSCHLALGVAASTKYPRFICRV